jgi:hypothetical protein
MEYVFMACSFIKHRITLCFTFTYYINVINLFFKNIKYCLHHVHTFKPLQNAVSIVTRLWVRPRFESWQGHGFFLFLTMSKMALRPTQPPVQCVMRALSPVVKQLECEGDHSPPPSADVKNAWSYTSTLSYFFTAWYFN